MQKKKQSSCVGGMPNTCCSNDCYKLCGTGGYVAWRRNQRTASTRC